MSTEPWSNTNTEPCDCSHRAPMWATWTMAALFFCAGILVGTAREKQNLCAKKTCPGTVRPEVQNDVCVCLIPAKDSP